MNRKSIVIILIIVLIGALLSGCVDNPKTESQATPAQTKYQKLHPKVNFDVQSGVAVNGDPGPAEAIKKDTLGIGFNNIGFAYDANTKKPAI